MVHGIVGVLFIAIMLAHIYIGTIGMQGAFEAMGKGEVDVNWARQHHSLWLEKRGQEGPRARPGAGRIAERREGQPMRVFLLACLFAVALGVGAAYVLNSGVLPTASSKVFSTQSVQIWGRTDRAPH